MRILFIRSVCGCVHMESKEFIEIFLKTLETNNDYNYILEDLNNNVFPFHDRDKFVTARRYYYWLKQNQSFKFKRLNGELKKLVKRKMKLFLEDAVDS
jgi:hypothetical protein